MLPKTFSNHCWTSQFRRKVSICFACLVLHVILLCHVVLLSCNDKFILSCSPFQASTCSRRLWRGNHGGRWGWTNIEQSGRGDDGKISSNCSNSWLLFLAPGNLLLHLDNKDILKNTAAELPWIFIVFIKNFVLPFIQFFSNVYKKYLYQCTGISPWGIQGRIPPYF